MTLPPLPDFNAFFCAANGHAPYPWQSRLAEQVVQEGRWPATIGVPTGAGKTSTLDIALYVLAAQASLEPSERTAPRRIAMVVDRRTIVDQSFAHAERLRSALASATNGPLHAIAIRLRSLMGEDSEREEPLALALLRGGIPRDDGWARRPDQALIAVSTVDQVGSRLLFRGYGVRPTMQSLHAGLLSHDTLLLLDEVHLARPFSETLDAIGDRFRDWRSSPLPDRWQVVALSATSGSANPFLLDTADHTHPRLQRRLNAPKSLSLSVVDAPTHTRSHKPDRRWLQALIDAVTAQVDAGHRCVGVVVNRVDVARALADRLDTRGRDVALVTGRMRGVDRVDVSADVTDRAGPGWPVRHAETERPFICVATQCIEAGADLDFDAMVTEIASLDALVQRVGRVNRTGDHAEAPITVLTHKDAVDTDPVYGAALPATRAWLEAQQLPLSASPSALSQATAGAPPDNVAPRTVAAVLLPAHLDLLSQTGPVPEPDPDPAHYLHGLEPRRAEVNVAWRADLPEDDEDAATARLLLAPPSSFEALALPYAAARSWLFGDPLLPFSDVGGDRAVDDADAPRTTRERAAWLWDGERATRLTRPAELRPGATVLVPGTDGGIKRGTFDPSGDLAVSDVGDLGNTLRSGRVRLRFAVRVYGEWDDESRRWEWPSGVSKPPVPSADQTRRETERAMRDWINVATPPEGTLFQSLLALLRDSGVGTLVWSDGCWVARGAHRLPTPVLLGLARGELAPNTDSARTADDGSIVSRVPVALDVHLRGVERWARSFAHDCGLPDPVAADVALAGRLHDLGKADPRFQVLLHDGDEIRAAAGEVLAKSGGALRDAAARQRAAKRARLPRGFRHEMMSVRMLIDHGRDLLAGAHDPDLVLHLVASHHGHARPFAPTEDHRRATSTEATYTHDGHLLGVPSDHALDRLDSGVSDRFWRVQRTYGWWGLAWLEAILRLADHRESEAAERSTGDSQ